MNWDRLGKTTLGVGLSLVLGAEAGWAAYSTIRYLRYPVEPVPSVHGPSPLDEFIAAAEVNERVSVRIAASTDVVVAAAWSFDVFRIPAVRAIFASRAFLMRGDLGEGLPSGATLVQLQQIGWGLLAEEPGRCAVFGSVTQPWVGKVVFTSLEPSEFATFVVPGFAKIAWSILAEADPAGGTRLVNETRVATTSPEARAKFRRYWAIFSPGILLIRYLVLRSIKAQVEQGGV